MIYKNLLYIGNDRLLVNLILMCLFTLPENYPDILELVIMAQSTIFLKKSMQLFGILYT